MGFAINTNTYSSLAGKYGAAIKQNLGTSGSASTEKNLSAYLNALQKTSEVSSDSSTASATTASSQTSADSPAAFFEPSIEGIMKSMLRDMGVDPETSGIKLNSFADANAMARGVTQQRLAQKMQALGIPESTKVNLMVGYDGKILVTNQFEGSKSLEASLNNDRSFANTFRAWSATSSILQAAREAEEFQEAYARDPDAAMAEFMHIFDQNRRNEFSATFENGELSSQFRETYKYS